MLELLNVEVELSDGLGDIFKVRVDVEDVILDLHRYVCAIESRMWRLSACDSAGARGTTKHVARHRRDILARGSAGTASPRRQVRIARC